MRRFERDVNGELVALTDPDEAQILATLTAQLIELVASPDAADPALARLLPDAYRDDPEAAAEFRRFTASGLSERKVLNARALLATLEPVADTGEVRLDPAASQAWLRCLTDIRLVLAARLSIETEDDDAGREVDPVMRDIYDWLGFIQNSLVEALDG